MSPLAFLILAASAVVPRFPREASPLALEGPARPAAYLEASGRRAAFVGREDGSFEAWVYPMKVLHGFELAFGIEDYASPIPGSGLASRVEVRPEAATIRYAQSSFTADATWLVPLEEPGGIVLLDIDASAPLTVYARFHTDMRLMWPAGLGGQYSYWDRELRAYVITESRRRHAAIVGSPLASDPPEQPAHNLPDAPTEMKIPVSLETAASGLVPIAIAASDEGLEAARATYRRLLEETESLYRATARHYLRLHEEMTRIDSPDDELDLALEWGKVALDKGFVCNPRLGCGLIAGLGPSGRSERPGFGWYFGGDAFINSWAMTAYGDFETVRESLRFLSKRQRADGKMMHELSQGAAYIPWFEEFPYGYYHADTTPLYILAVSDFLRESSDPDFAREIWPSIRRAYEYCASTDEDGDGLMDNTRAGLGAVETGALRSAEVLTDVYLAAAWTAAAKAASDIADLVGEKAIASEARAAHEKARGALNRRFLDEANPGIAFALLRSGSAQPEVTSWPAFGLWRGLFDSGPPVEAALDALAGSRLGSDWGARMLSNGSALYSHQSYNNGAVWPFLSGFAALALYENGRPHAGHFYVDGAKSLPFLEGLESRGYVAELYSGDRLKAIDAAVPHQLFSTAGLVSPLLRGLVGIAPGRLAPRIPPGWHRLRVENLRNGGLYDLDWTRRRSAKETIETLTLTPKEGSSIPPLVVERSLPLGAKRLAGGSLPWSPKPGGEAQTHSLRYRGGIEVVPLHDPLRSGERSSRLRILHERLEGATYVARLEGRRGRTYRLRVEGGEPRVVEVQIPEGPGEWGPAELRVPVEE
jgi:glycogen debranching enzyme